MHALLALIWLSVLRSADAALAPARRRRGEDRGDVPGWVLITVMSAGLVVALWAAAGTKLGDMLDTALSSVTGS